MSENPIAGVDLEAEQVVEEEAEKPVAAKKKKIRPIFLIFGGIVVLEAVVLFMVFGAVGGGTPSEGGDGEAHAEEKKAEVNEASLEEIAKRGPFGIGDISHLEPAADDPSRNVEVTLTGLTIVFDEEGWGALQKLFGKNESAEKLIKIELQSHVRAFLASRGADYIVRRMDTVSEDLLFYFQEMNEDAIGGLSQHIVQIGFDRVKQQKR